jgi:hypothetical protein
MTTRWQYFLLACPLLGCGNAPPAAVVRPVMAETFYSRVVPTSLVCLKWPDGHAVLVWTDIEGFCGGGAGPCPAGVAYAWSHREIVTRRKPSFPEAVPGAPQPPGPPTVTTTNEETGRAVNWRCETGDGVTGRMVIGTELFDLTKGNLFLVSTAAGEGVTQLTRDLSGLEMTHESIADLAKRDEAIRKFVTAATPSQ